ncbi:MAG: GNAT family N-acetyltransferase [Anaerolineales bacterium]|nr:GNAT family N-acetyltransferase [Anaerolineales bacterium]
MTLERIQTFRKLVTLRDGTRVLFRLLDQSDAGNLVDFFQSVTKNDLRYVRSNIKDENVVSGWATNIDYDRVLPVIAIVQDRIVGEATLHMKKGPHAHVSELRIFLSSDFRRRGLGVQMLEVMFELARWRNIYLLEAQIVADQTRVIKAFKKMGFEQQGLLEDYFMMPERETRDVALLIKRLMAPQDEF